MPRHVQLPPGITDGEFLRYDAATDTMLPVSRTDIVGLVNVVRDRLVASGGETEILLGQTPSAPSLLVWKNASLLWPGLHYDLVGGMVDFHTPLSGGDVIEDYYITAETTSYAAVLSTGPESTSYGDGAYGVVAF